MLYSVQKIYDGDVGIAYIYTEDEEELTGTSYIRPIVVLTSNVGLVSGTGETNDPWIIQ